MLKNYEKTFMQIIIIKFIWLIWLFINFLINNLK